MTVLLDLTRAVERFVATRSPESVERLYEATTAARGLLDDEANMGRTEALAELLWRRHRETRTLPWSELMPAHADVWRSYARTVLLSGLI